MSNQVDRRDFLKTAAIAGAGLGLGVDALHGQEMRGALPRTAPGVASDSLFRTTPMERVRMAFVGVGHQGTSHIQNFLRIDNVDIVAICDIVPDHVARSQKLVTDAGKPRPGGYSNGHEDFRRMMDTEKLDLVLNATPWQWHAPVMLHAMRGGMHAATEVPMGVTLDELWELVETAEQTGRHCVMMENCCYDRAEMMILNMVRQGLFGSLMHAECGYLHDLRELKLTDYYVERWRVKHSITRNGDLYPTHGIGPVAQWMDINRGNQFDYLVSMASPARGLNQWAAEHIGPDSPEARQHYSLGDVVNTLIRTKSGQTILVTHDTDLPRPYSRKILLQGTEGLVRKYPEPKIHIEGRSRPHQWEPLQAYQAEFEHPVWKTLEERAAGAGHGGMDYIEDYRLIQCLREGLPMDMDVYDGAAWSAIVMLSEQSIATRSRPVDFPDFTRGAWMRRPPLPVVRL